MVTTPNPQPDHSYFLMAIERALFHGGVKNMKDFAPHEVYQTLKLAGWQVTAKEANQYDEWSVEQLADLAKKLEKAKRWVPGHLLHHNKLSPVEAKKAEKAAEKRERELSYYLSLPIATLFALIEMEDSEITRGLMVQAANAQWHELQTAAQHLIGKE